MVHTESKTRVNYLFHEGEFIRNGTKFRHRMFSLHSSINILELLEPTEANQTSVINQKAAIFFCHFGHVPSVLSDTGHQANALNDGEPDVRCCVATTQLESRLKSKAESILSQVEKSTQSTFDCDSAYSKVDSSWCKSVCIGHCLL
jgi:hypothetical protein